jgi:hypothetical protein
MIERADLQEMFDSMRVHANAHWSIDDVCLWGYFFTDGDESNLREAAHKLEALGYRVVGLDPDEDDPDLLWLHVEKEERHTVDSLQSRNEELYRLADEWGLESYDGMDVGPVENTGV